MQRLFGIPVGPLAIALAFLLGAVGAAVLVLALRHRILLRLSLRNLARRRGRAALIVAGLMLGTTIIGSALVTGDTMSRTVRSGVLQTHGFTDELVAVRGADLAFFDASRFDAASRALRATGAVDGVAPAIIVPVALQSAARTDARVSLYAPDPAHLDGFGSLDVGSLAPGEAYLNRDAAEELDAAAGDTVSVLADEVRATLRVREVVDAAGLGDDGSAVVLPLAAAQELLHRDGQIRYVLVSNRGDETSGAERTDQVLTAAPALALLGLELLDVKRDGLELADRQGDTFMTMFSMFGSFSVAAGILLIFLIFVMLSAERRSELGIARAIGTRREHVVELFVFEGLAYDLGAAAIGTALGVAVAFAMVSALAFGVNDTGFDIQRAATAPSLVIAYALGVLLTFVVVVLSAWRVSVLNIVAAVRGLPEPLTRHGGRRRIGLGLLGLAGGAALVAVGYANTHITPFSLGLSLVVVSLVPLARAASAPERVAYTAAGALLVAWWLLPFEVMNAIAGRELVMDFSAWVAGGLALVAGATWLIVYNADVLLGVTMRVASRVRALTPVLKMAMAYPLRVRFRTGDTLAMFMLVVFTIAVGATTTRSFLRAVDDVEAFGGGSDVQAQVAPTTPLRDARAAVLRAVPGTFDVVASESVVDARMAQAGGEALVEYPVRGFDESFLQTTTYGLAARGRGYDSAHAVWQAIAREPDLAIVDGLVAPRRAAWNFGAPTDFRLHGFFLEDKVFDPVPVIVRDPSSGRTRTVSVIGVLSDTAPTDMVGLWTSQRTATTIFGTRSAPTLLHLTVAPGVDPDAAAGRLERAFLDHGMEADSVRAILHDLLGANLTMNWLLLGFMGLGLIVGVAALGVVSARSVVERRAHIGVLRSIGFRRGMVQASMLLESAFVALTAIVVGTTLGLVVAGNVISDSAAQPSWQGSLHFVVPWVELTIVFVAVLAAALLTALVPAVRAARVDPAQALRYE